MIITKSSPFTASEIKKLKERFITYIKTVIDVKNEICSAGCDRHFESEKTLLNNRSEQKDLWGGGIDLKTKIIDFNSFINIRPSDGNASSEIQDAKIREKYKKLSQYFFKNIL
jgi:hypothetical protein